MKAKRDSFKAKKGDQHPFGIFMHHDEKILWMDGQYTLASPNGLKTYAYVSLASLLLWIMALSQIAATSVVLSTSGACLFLILAAGIPIALRPEQFSRPPKGLYALTNEHLFYWNGSEVKEVLLDDLASVQLVPGAGSQGTLSFGSSFPAIPDIDDAAYVKTMIEQAQKERGKELSA